MSCRIEDWVEVCSHTICHFGTALQSLFFSFPCAPTFCLARVDSNRYRHGESMETSLARGCAFLENIPEEKKWTRRRSRPRIEKTKLVSLDDDRIFILLKPSQFFLY